MKNLALNKRINILIAAILLINISTIGAQTKSKLKKINYFVKDNKLVVEYDIKGGINNNTVNLVFYNTDFNYIYPKHITGDYGTNVTSGKNKQIIWDVSNDLDEINLALKPLLILNGKDKRRYGGPKNAWLSALVPGLGDYFVADPIQVSFKPYLRTIASYGFIGLGIYALNQRHRPIITTVRTNANNPDQTTSYLGPTEYWAFQIDGELFLTIGVGVWIYDILWVAIRGKKNAEYKSRIDGLSFYDQNSNSFQYGIALSLHKN